MPQFPRGLRDVDLTELDDSGALGGTVIGNIYPISVGATYQSDTAELVAADVRQEQSESNERYNITLKVGGTPLAVIAMMEGSTVETSGTGATLKSLVRKNVSSNQRPFFRLRAQQRDKAGGHTTWIWPKVSAAGSISVTANQNEYAEPEIALVAYPVTEADATVSSAESDFYYLVQGATFVALADLDDDIDTIAA